MLPAIVITDLNGSRKLSELSLPLRIGTDQDADIRLPAWDGDGSIAQISLLEDRCFVQPQSQEVQLLLNGVSLVTPRWLDDGDVLSVGDAEIELHEDGNQIEFEVIYSSEESPTVPPLHMSIADADGQRTQSDGMDEVLLPPLPTTSTDSAHLRDDVDGDAQLAENYALDSDSQDSNSNGKSNSGQGDFDLDREIQRPEILDLDDAPEPDDIMVPLPSGPVRSASPTTTKPPPRRRSRSVLFAWLLFISLIAYVWMAGKITIIGDAPNTKVSLAETAFAPGVAGRYFLLPGQYEFLVSAPGFETQRRLVEIDFLERKTLTVPLQAQPGLLAFDLPADVKGELWINGEFAAELADLPLALPQGSYNFQIISDRFQDYQGTVDIDGLGKLQTLAVELATNFGSFAVASQPAGAEIYLDDKLLGTTPATVDVATGNHDLELRLEGYQTSRQSVNSQVGKVEVLPRVQLERIGGSVQIVSNPAGTTVSRDDQVLGRTPLNINIPVGESVSLRFSKAGYAPVDRVVEVENTTPLDLAVELTALTGTVAVEANPKDAVLFIDGELVGSATQLLELTAIEHNVEVRLAGYETWVTKITPTPGVFQRLDVTLRRAGEIDLGLLAGSLRTSLGQKLNLVGPGELVLGSPAGVAGRRANEVARSVRLSRPFYLAVKEVTNSEFRLFNPRHQSGANSYPELSEANHPVVNLTWGEAAAYCNWLSDRDGLERAYVMKNGQLQLVDPPNSGYRLPTEAEWAWVARYNSGNGESRFAWGQAMPPTLDSGNFADATALEVVPNVLVGYSDGYRTTAPVGSFSPNAQGFYDLGGNVAEWVNDFYGTDASGTQKVDPLGPPQGQFQVVRGSSWRHGLQGDLRLAARDYSSERRDDVGFRLARYAPPPAAPEELELAGGAATVEVVSADTAVIQ